MYCAAKTMVVYAALFVSIGLVSARLQAEEAQEKSRPLWDGQTLKGWHQSGGGSWTVEEGAIVGRHERSDRRHGHLVTDAVFGDFTIRVTYKALKGNSGLYFRIEEIPGPVGVKGFQAEIDARNDIGGLYETHGRGWVVKPTPEQVKKYFKPDDWNEMIVEARGRNVVVHVNGVKTAELTNDPGRLTGHIALQLHGSQDMDVRFKQIEIQGEPIKK